MDTLIRNILSRLSRQLNNLVLRHAPSSQHGHAHTLQPLVKILLPITPDSFHMVTLRPAIYRPLEMLLHDIHKARLLEIAAIVAAILPAGAERLGGRDGFGLPQVDVRALETAVNVAHGEHDVVELEVAAGVELVEGRGYDVEGFFEAGD